MTEYLVRWEIELDADGPEGAARRAQEFQRDPDSIATVFDVAETGSATSARVDLTTGAVVALAPPPASDAAALAIALDALRGISRPIRDPRTGRDWREACEQAMQIAQNALTLIEGRAG